VRQKIVLGGDVWQDKREWKKKREKYWRESSGDGYVRDGTAESAGVGKGIERAWVMDKEEESEREGKREEQEHAFSYRRHRLP